MTEKRPDRDRDEQRRDRSEDPASESDSEGTTKADGLGEDGTIPSDPDGVAAGHTGTASTFEPEEDELAE